MLTDCPNTNDLIRLGTKPQTMLVHTQCTLMETSSSRYQLDREATFDDVSSPYKSSSSLMTFLISLHCTPSTNTCQAHNLCY